jgi:LPXTG-motif cell wall-anchored protein
MKSRLPLLLLALCALLLAPLLASAHADLVSSTPADGSTMTAAPSRVTAVFDEELASDGSTLTVVDAAGKRVDAGDGKLDLDDLEHQTLIVSLKSGLGAGVYTVRWSAVSGDDGDTTSGSFSFTVKAAGTAEPTATVAAGKPTPTAPADPRALPPTGSSPLHLPWLGLAVLLLAAGGALVLLRRARG